MSDHHEHEETSTEHSEESGNPTPCSEGSGLLWAIVIAIIGIAASLLLTSGNSTAEKIATNEPEVRASAAQVEAARRAEFARTNPQVVVPAEKPWTFQTIEIPHNGIALNLYPGWQSQPLGGAVTITSPDGKVYQDKPGEDLKIHTQDPAGKPRVWIFLADPPGSRRQEKIWNRW